MTVLITLTTDKPVIGTLCFTGYRDVISRFSLQVLGLIPVACHILDELEGVGILLIVFRQIGCHLEWTVHSKIKCQLTYQCGTYIRCIVAPDRKSTRLNSSHQIIS